MMRRLAGGAALMFLVPGAAGAVGLDRSGQAITTVFEEGNYFELSFGFIEPSIDGTDLDVFGGRDSGNVGGEYSQVRGALKYQLNPDLSVALIVDQPYGTDILYPEADADSGSLALGGTRAEVESSAITALARYRFGDAFSVHGGLRYQQIKAGVTLQGAAYGGLSGYNAEFDTDGAYGYLIGAAYERPDIALRVALTYFSEVEHDLPTTETLNGVPVNLIDPRLSPTSTTSVKTPAAVNLDFQTGIAPGTLLFGSIRHAMYGETVVSPVFFDQALPGERDSLTDLMDNTEYNIGVGRRLTDVLSGSVSVGYQPEEEDDLVSPLSPTSGRYSATLGLAYDVSPAFTVFGGMSYTWLGDARPETSTPDTARAEFTDNDAFAVGVRLGYTF